MLDIQNIGLVELSAQEGKEIEGGCIFCEVIRVIGDFIRGFESAF